MTLEAQRDLNTILALIDINGTPELREAADMYRRHQRQLNRKKPAFDAAREDKPMKHPRPTHTKKASTAPKTADELAALTPDELMRRWDAMSGADDDEPPVTTPEQAIQVLLEDYDNMPPDQQRAYRAQVRRTAVAMDEMLEAESARQDVRECKAAEQFYADRKRLMNNLWTDERGTWRGDLHPERTTRYR